MQIQQINVEGFGTLSQCRITGLSNRLSVIHGMNGTGKTTVLHFLTGVLCGFENARRARLIPPQKPGAAGGSLIVQNASGRFEIIRHSRNDQTDTLAISLLSGTTEDVATLRKTLQTLPANQIAKLYTVTGYGVHDLAGLVQFALDEGVELGARSNSGAWISERVRLMESERADLFRTAPTQGTLVALEQKQARLKATLEETRQNQLLQLADWQHSLQLLRDQIEKLTSLRNWQHLELQSTETDLTEVQDRLWSTQVSTVQDVETVHRVAPRVDAEWINKIAAIDQEIAHVQQVLRDLAASRMTLSVSKADLAGAEVPHAETMLQRQRHALSLIETQTNQLTAVLSQLQQQSACICGPQSRTLQTNVNVIRDQVWLICQELGRQQSTLKQESLQTEREGLDRCEHELIRQIQRLRLRRDDVLQSRSRTAADQVHFRTLHEANGCECQGHEDAVAAWQPTLVGAPVSPQVIVRERTVTVSGARPGDAALETELLARRALHRQRLAGIVEKLRLARLELQQLESAAREFAGDHTAQSVCNELVEVEQQLADAREQWQSLTLLQTVLLRTQQKLNQEAISPVIRETSQYLERMTEGRYLRVRWDQNARELLVINSADLELPAQALSRGTLEQTVLCLRLALCHEFQRRGQNLPLVLDDVLADSDEDRLRAAADVLDEFSRTHQVLFLTCQEHLVDLLSARDAAVFNLPGTPAHLRRTNLPAVTSVQAAAPAPVITEPVVEIQIPTESARTQPDEPYWLQFSSPINHVPSLGEQMARRLGALGIRNVGDLVDLDLASFEVPLDSLQISQATLRQWQNEARLLCCVPNLTGRDAQLLVLCGISSPAELAASDVDTLMAQIVRIRSSRIGEYDTHWLGQSLEWPTHSHLERWIRSGRSARSWRSARDWSAERKIHLRQQTTRSRKRTLQPAGVPEAATVVRIHSELEAEVPESEWKFYLQLSSPIVDAPSIGPRMAERLNAIGINQVSQLLALTAADVALRLNRREVTEEVVRAWQQQAQLMCRVPQLRGHDVQVLVACGVENAEMLSRMSPAKLFTLIEPFVNSKEGIRMLRSSRIPDLAEVSEWISYARRSPALRAA